MSSDKITFTYIYDKVPLVTGKQVQRLERKGDITSHILCCIGGDDMIDAEFKNDEFNKQTVINLIIQKLYIQYGIQLIGSTNGGNNEELTSALN